MDERQDMSASGALHNTIMQTPSTRQLPLSTFSPYRRGTTPEAGPIPIDPALERWTRGVLRAVVDQLSYAEVLRVLVVLGLDVPPVPDSFRSKIRSRISNSASHTDR